MSTVAMDYYNASWTPKSPCWNCREDQGECWCLSCGNYLCSYCASDGHVCEALKETP